MLIFRFCIERSTSINVWIPFMLWRRNHFVRYIIILVISLHKIRSIICRKIFMMRLFVWAIINIMRRIVLHKCWFDYVRCITHLMNWTSMFSASTDFTNTPTWNVRIRIALTVWLLRLTLSRSCIVFLTHFYILINEIYVTTFYFYSSFLY